jgi:uncharacterized membrane protein YcaP (DUF421 family)
MLCKYKDIFGKVKTGVHSIRLFDIAIIDVIGTILIGVAINYYTKINIFIILIILFLLAIILHKLFCVNTTINRLIFGKI